MRGAVVVVMDDVGRFDRESAATWHRVPRIDDEVRQCRFELAQVGANRWKVRLAHDLEIDVLPNQLPQHPGQRADGVVEIDTRRVQHLAPPEREKLTGQRGRPVGGRQNLGGIPRRFIVVRYLLRDQRAEADDRRKDVVEVVRDPAGKLSDGLHFLYLIELTFEPFAIGEHRRQLRFALPQRDGDTPLGFIRHGCTGGIMGGLNDVLTPGVVAKQRLYQRAGVGIRINQSKADGAGSGLSHSTAPNVRALAIPR
jgi:hypothetical protein